MRHFQRRNLLAVSLAGALSLASPAIAQQVIADGETDFKMPPSGDYWTSKPGEHAFHALNGGTILGNMSTSLLTEADDTAAVRAEGANSLIALSDMSFVRTTGHGSSGVSVAGGGFEASKSRIETRGDNASGVDIAGGFAVLSKSVVDTIGVNSHGVVAQAGSRVILERADILTQGEGAWGVVIHDDAALDMKGAYIHSAQHGAVRVRGNGSTGLRLNEGSLLVGGNGTALALDASVAGRFDVALDASTLRGDIVISQEDLDAGLVPASDVHVRLSNASNWNGRTDIVNSVTIEGGSWWTLRGDSQVKSMDVHYGSSVYLSDPSDAGFNTLTIEGDLHSENAEFQFRGGLEGDDSAMDRLHVRGDTSGDAQIWVSNVGGLGAKTIEGITVIQVDGASNADYKVHGRVVAGAHEYFLHKGGVVGGEGNSYLRSALLPDLCERDPSLPGCTPVDPVDPIDPVDPVDPIGPIDPIEPPAPLLRPEVGAYLANQSAALKMFDHRLSDRVGALDAGEGRNAWARVARQQSDFTAVGGQLSVDGSTSMLQVGSDLLRRGNATLGVMLGSGRADSTVVSTLTGYSAKGRVRGTAIGMYGTWVQNPGQAEGAYVDASVQHGRFDNRVQGAGLGRETYHSQVTSASLESGYTFAIWQGTSSNVYLQPQLQLSYADLRAGRHVESNGTVIENADASGLSGRVGVRVSGRGTATSSVVQPYLGVNWLRGSGTRTVQFNGDTLGVDLPRNRYEAQAGAELKLGQRWAAWGGMTLQRGDRGYRDVVAQLGVRKAW